jgi:hypothetical protein
MLYVLTHGTFAIVDTPHKGEILGQQLDLSEDLAKSVILGGGHILPKEDFDALGFTKDEVAKYSNARLQMNAPDSFKTKHAAAQKAVWEHRARLAAPVTDQPAARDSKTRCALVEQTPATPKAAFPEVKS